MNHVDEHWLSFLSTLSLTGGSDISCGGIGLKRTPDQSVMKLLLTVTKDFLVGAILGIMPIVAT